MSLNLRNTMNKRRPAFIRQEKGQRKEVKSSWRKSRGLHSKMKLGVHGKPASPNKGYRGPKDARGLSNTGEQIVLIHTENELASMTKGKVAILAHTGMKQRAILVKLAHDKKIKLLNVKNPVAYLEQVQQKMNERKKTQPPKKEETPTPEKKEQVEKKPEQKPEEAKKEFDKLLTKPQ